MTEGTMILNSIFENDIDRLKEIFNRHFNTSHDLTNGATSISKITLMVVSISENNKELDYGYNLIDSIQILEKSMSKLYSIFCYLDKLNSTNIEERNNARLMVYLGILFVVQNIDNYGYKKLTESLLNSIELLNDYKDEFEYTTAVLTVASIYTLYHKHKLLIIQAK